LNPLVGTLLSFDFAGKTRRARNSLIALRGFVPQPLLQRVL
jgi:hypothetical protein